jgi:exodeoxyribonuclease VII large subunit
MGPGVTMSEGPRAAEPAWRISALNAAIAEALRVRFPAEVWVVGEISNLRHRSGTAYFDLVEHDGDRGRTIAQLPAAVLRWERARFDADLARIEGFALADGIEVLVGGRVDLFEPWGRVQLRVTRIDPAHTLGHMQAARDRLMAELAARGVLRANRRRTVGRPPLRIGLVTAPGTKGEQDLLSALAASGWPFHVVRAGARVQGPTCEVEVARALGRLARLHEREPLDVVALVRGGGSAVDLQGFDAPGVAEAIVAAPFPVWTGLGHEQDRSVADEVAHACWPTPTAVGRELVDAVAGCANEVDEAAGALAAGAQGLLEATRRDLARAGDRLAGGVTLRLRAAHAELDRAAGQLQGLPRTRLAREERDLTRVRASLATAAAGATTPGERTRLARAAGSLVREAEQLVAARRGRLELAQARLASLDPAVQLQRGFSITRDHRGAVVRSVRDVPVGAQLVTEVADGRLVSRRTTDDQEAT